MPPHMKSSKNKWSGIVAIALCLVMVFPSLSNLSQAELPSWPSSGETTWTITSSESYQDREIIVANDIFVLGQLTLSNVILRMKMHDGIPSTLYVEKGGILNVKGGSIEGYDSQQSLKIVIDGGATFDGVTITGLYGNSEEPQSGIIVRSDDVTITNCDIGPMGVVGGSGIYLYRSHAIIENTKIHGFHWGIYEDGASILTEPNFSIISTDITYSSNDPVVKAGSIVTIEASVDNAGGRDAIALVSFYDGNPKTDGIIISESTQVITGSSSATFSTDWTASVGDHEIYVIVDRTNSVGETDESDNIASIDLNVRYMVQVFVPGGDSFRPLIDVPVYAFKDGTYTGISGNTDNEGIVYLPIVDTTGEYIFKTDYLGYRFSSDSVEMPASSSSYISISGGRVLVSVQTTYNLNSDYLNDIPVYLFKPDYMYMGKSSNTHDYYSYAGIDVPSMPYIYRADYLGIQKFSEIYTYNPEDLAPQVTIIFQEGCAVLTIKQGNDLLDGVPVYVFDSNGNYLNMNMVSGSGENHGQVEFFLPEGNYEFRADYQDNSYWAKNDGSKIVPIVKNIVNPIEINLEGKEFSISVEDGSGHGIDGVNVYAFTYPGLAYIGMFDTTKNGGIAKIKVASGSFEFRADYLGSNFWSNPVNVPDDESTLINLHLRTVIVSVNKDYNGHLSGIGSGVPVYLFDAQQAYLGKYDHTDDAGRVHFDLPDGKEFNFRADFMGYQFMTPDPFMIDANVAPHVDILHGDATIFVKTTYNGVETTLDQVPVYVFTSLDNYISLSGQTLSNGKVQFCLPVQEYKFRADYLGNSYMTEALTPTFSHDIIIEEGKARIIVMDGGNPASFIPVFVFTWGHAYLSMSGMTDGNGIVEFQLPVGTYSFRADFGNDQHWTGVHSINAELTTDISIPELARSISNDGNGSASSRSGFIFSVEKAVGMPIKGANVFVFLDGHNSYLGISGTTNDAGTISLPLAEGTYDFRIDYLGLQFWDDGVQVLNDGIHEFVIPHHDVTFKFEQTPTPDRADRLQGLPMYLFSSGDLYLGQSKTTGPQGEVVFNLPDEAIQYFKVRCDYLGYSYFSNTINVPYTDPYVTISIAHQWVRVYVTRQFKDQNNDLTQSPVPDGTHVYLFTSSPLAYLNEYVLTQLDVDGKSYADFYLPAQAYSFRADYLSFQFWSGSTAEGLPTIQIKEVLAKVHVTQGSSNLNDVPIYVFNTGGAYLGLNGVTQTGYYTVQLPVQNYYFRADLNGHQYFSSNPIVLQWDDAQPGIVADVPIDADGGDLQITVNDGTNPIQGANVYIFTMDDSYINQHGTTDINGLTTIHLTGGNYKIRIDYLGGQWWFDNSNNNNNPPEGYNPPDQLIFTIPHQDVTAKIMFAGEPLKDIPVYLFTSDDVYLDKTATTSDAGTVHWFLPQATYNIRVDYAGSQYWMSDVTIDSSGPAYPQLDLAPDLIIQSGSITYSSSPALVGKETTITATINNYGLTDANNFFVSVYTGPPATSLKFKSDEKIESIPSGGSGTITFSWTPETTSQTEFYFVVDSNNEVSEVHEDNNEASVAITSENDIAPSQLFGLEIYSVDIGIYSINSNVQLYGSNIYAANVAIDLESSNSIVTNCMIYSVNNVATLVSSDLILENTQHERNKINADGPSHYKSLRTLTVEVLPHALISVDIGGIQYNTDPATGILTTDLIEYDETGTHAYYQIRAGQSHVHVFMTDIRKVTMYTSGDSDNDGLSDDIEDTSQYQFNAYELAYQLKDGNYLSVPNEMPAVEQIGELPAGKYYLHFNAIGDSINVQVNDFATKTYNLKTTESDYWYEFTLNAITEVRISLSTTHIAKVGSCILTNAMIYTSPLSSDTDNDKLGDYQEFSANEQFYNVGGVLSSDDLGGDAAIINHGSDYNFVQATLAAGYYQIYYNAYRLPPLTWTAQYQFSGCHFNSIASSPMGTKTIAVGTCTYLVGSGGAVPSGLMTGISWFDEQNSIAVGNNQIFLLGPAGNPIYTMTAPYPMSNVISTSSTTAIAIGANGHLLNIEKHSSSLTISSGQVLGITNLNGVTKNGPNVLIVGDSGSVYLGSGTSFLKLAVPTEVITGSFHNSVWLSGTEALIFGDNGNVLKMTIGVHGTVFETMANGVLGTISGAILNSGTVYLVGDGVYTYDNGNINDYLSAPNPFSGVSSNLYATSGGSIYKIDTKTPLSVSIDTVTFNQNLGPIKNWYSTPEFYTPGNPNIKFSSESLTYLDSIDIIKTREAKSSAQLISYTNPSGYLLDAAGIFTSGDGELRNGDKTFSIDTVTRLISDDSRIYAGDSGHVYSIGKDLGSNNYNSWTVTNPMGIVLHGNDLYVTTSDTLYARDKNKLNPTDPVTWSWSASNALTVGPIFINDTIIVATSDTLYGIKDGEKKWEYSLASTPISILAGTGIIIVIEQNKIEAVDPSIYDQNNIDRHVWSLDGSYTDAIVTDGLIIARSPTGLAAFSENDGASIWAVLIIATAPPSANNGLLYTPVGSEIEILDLSSGFLIDSIAVSASITKQPLIGDIDHDNYLEIVVMTTGGIDIVNGVAKVTYKDLIPWGVELKDSEGTSYLAYSNPYQPILPMESDSDNDGVPDGQEFGALWNYDKIQIEDFYTRSASFANGQFNDVYLGKLNPVQRLNVIKHQFNVNITSTWDFANSYTGGYLRCVSNIPTGGYYRYTIEGTATIGMWTSPQIPPGSPPISVDNAIVSQLADEKYHLSENALKINVRKDPPPLILPQQPVKTIFINKLLPGAFPVDESREIREARVDNIPTYYGYTAGTVKYFHIEVGFNLPAGIYSMELSIDPKYLGQTFNQNGELDPLGLYFLYIKDINVDYTTISSTSYNQLNADSDSDSLTDGYELTHGSYPMSADSDKDGLSDPTELSYGTSPVERDTDFDGIRDRIELGLGKVSTDPYTVYDTLTENSDADTTNIATDPLNKDWDGDGLPDGVIDGWGLKYDSVIYSSQNWGMNGIIDWNHDWSAEPWEGEDLNGNGRSTDQAIMTVNGHLYNYQETSPTLSDTDADGMSDSWENWFLLDPNNLNGVNDASLDGDVLTGPLTSYYYSSPWQFQYVDRLNGVTPDSDGLTNSMEFTIGTNPRTSDTDGDGLSDGHELALIQNSPILARTNVMMGALTSRYYGVDGQQIWVRAIGTFSYSYTVNDPDTSFEGIPNNWNGKYTPTNIRVLGYLRDRSWIFISTDNMKIYVWQAGMFPTILNGPVKGSIYVFEKEPSIFTIPENLQPLSSYTYQEFYTSDPFCGDSDGDGNRDSLEISPFGVFTDINQNGFSNARDWDTDGDGVKDSYEEPMQFILNSPPIGLYYNPSSGRSNPWEVDTDNDMILDDTDLLPTDYDNDGLSGYPAFITQYLAQSFFIAGSEEAKFKTFDNNVDSDGDHLLDGYTVTIMSDDYRYDTFIENSLYYKSIVKDGTTYYTFLGEVSLGTDPKNTDTDGDGLWDGPNVGNNIGELTPIKIFVSEYVDAKGGHENYPQTYTTNPMRYDTDGDKLLDGYNQVLDKNSNLAKEFDAAGIKVDNKNGDSWTFYGELRLVTPTNPTLRDTDGGGLDDKSEIESGLKPLDYTDDNFVDILGDGIDDHWESKYFVTPDNCDPKADTDNDGLTNYEEYLNNTNPLVADTDHDGAKDGWEVKYGFDPLDPNYPSDAIDSDKDGISDKKEGKLGSNPHIDDTDGDGLKDGQEDANQNGIVDPGETDPVNPDTDGDLISDGKDTQPLSFNVIKDWTLDYCIAQPPYPNADLASIVADDQYCAGLTLTIELSKTIAGGYDITATKVGQWSAYVIIHIAYNPNDYPGAQTSLKMYQYIPPLNSGDPGTYRLFVSPQYEETSSVDVDNHFIWGATWLDSTRNSITVIGKNPDPKDDADKDGIPDINEITNYCDKNGMCRESAIWLSSTALDDNLLMAHKGIWGSYRSGMASADPSAPHYIIEHTFYNIESDADSLNLNSEYNIMIRAQSISTNSATMTASVQTSPDPATDRTEYPIVLGSDNLKWIYLPDPITPLIDSFGRPFIDLRISGKDIGVDCIGLIKQTSSGNWRVQSRQMTSPGIADMDGDGLLDGQEVRNNIYWIEAETQPIIGSLQPDVDASGGYYIKGLGEIIDSNVFLALEKNLRYDLFIRCKYEPVNEESPTIRITITDSNNNDYTLLKDGSTSWLHTSDWIWIDFSDQAFHPTIWTGSFTLKLIVSGGGSLSVDKFLFVQNLGLNSDLWHDKVRICDVFEPDTDYDHLSDSREYKQGTFSISTDTDGDSYNDNVDIDPTVDLSLTIDISRVTLLYPEQYSEPDIMAVVDICPQGCAPSLITEVTSQFIEPGYSNVDNIFAYTENIPDNIDTVDISISIWDLTAKGSIQFDTVGTESKTLRLSYHLSTGIWDSIYDKIGDYNGMGVVSGSDDFSTNKDAAEMHFSITQNDFDNDGLIFPEEVKIGTNPINEDTDEDGISDGTEWWNGKDPLHAAPCIDTDSDGICDFRELAGFQKSRYSFIYKTDPNNVDTDGDGLNDLNDPIPLDYDINGNGQLNDPYWAMGYSTDKIYTGGGIDINSDDLDMDGDGIPDSQDIDRDNDGMINTYEETYGSWQKDNIHNERYAILIVTAGKTDVFINHKSFQRDMKLLYTKLRNDYNFKSNNLYLLNFNNPNDEEIPITDMTTEDAILSIFVELSHKGTNNDLLFIATDGHNNANRVDSTGKPLDGTINQDLAGLLNNENMPLGYFNNYLEKQHEYINVKTKELEGLRLHFSRFIVIITECYSNNFLDIKNWPNFKEEFTFTITPPSITHTGIMHNNRLVITCTSGKGNNECWNKLGHDPAEYAFWIGGNDYTEYFHNSNPGFIESLGSSSSPRSIEQVYEKTDFALEHNYRHYSMSTTLINKDQDFRSYPEMWKSENIQGETYI